MNNKISEKEKSIKELIEKLRQHLNSQSITFKENPNNWVYPSSLSFSETKLKEIIEFITQVDIINTNK
jgi:hypothetical protein